MRSAAAGRCSTACPSTSRPASGSRSSAAAARASRRSPICSCANSIRRADACSSMASICAPRGSTTCAGTCSSSTRIRSSSTRRSPRTFAMRGPTRATDAVLAAADAAGLSALRRAPAPGARAPAPVSEDGRCPRASVSGSRWRARFLADPAVLVLDEATGALDPATEAQVAAGYEAVMAGRTTIIITHRLELARRADRVLVLERGRIVEEGSAATLIGLGQSFASLFSCGHTPADALTERATHADRRSIRGSHRRRASRSRCSTAACSRTIRTSAACAAADRSSPNTDPATSSTASDTAPRSRPRFARRVRASSCIAARIFDRQLATSVDILVRAIQWAADEGAQLINLSLGTTNPAHEEKLAPAIIYAAERGALVVSAREWNGAAWLPGSLAGVVGVRGRRRARSRRDRSYMRSLAICLPIRPRRFRARFRTCRASETCRASRLPSRT